MTVKRFYSKYIKVLHRTSTTVDVEMEVIAMIVECFLYELADELVMAEKIDIPSIGLLSINPQEFVIAPTIKKLIKTGGSYAAKFRRAHENSVKRGVVRGKKNRRSSE